MGIINLTEDSFYAGSRMKDHNKALQLAEKMIDEGVDILDLGAMSSRPGAQIIPSERETDVLIPMIKALSTKFQCLISVDTIHAQTARKCLEAGAHMINDISGGDYDEKMMTTVHQFHGAYVMMHMRGTPLDMARQNHYPKGVTLEVIKELKMKLNRAHNMGFDNIIVDPGFGFAKNVDQNFEILSQLGALHVLDHPLLIGLSRKSMIWRSLDISPDEALNGTTALHMAALQHHPHILRVHDVKEANQAITLFHKTNTQSS